MGLRVLYIVATLLFSSLLRSYPQGNMTTPKFVWEQFINAKWISQTVSSNEVLMADGHVGIVQEGLCSNPKGFAKFYAVFHKKSRWWALVTNWNLSYLYLYLSEDLDKINPNK